VIENAWQDAAIITTPFIEQIEQLQREPRNSRGSSTAKRTAPQWHEPVRVPVSLTSPTASRGTTW
jgi:hypothetical protein